MTNMKIKNITLKQIQHQTAVPKYMDASYSGYTGAKLIPFPINKATRTVPDITEGFNNFVRKTIEETNNIKGEFFGRIKLLRAFLKNFATGEKWDTKFSQHFPGRDKNGKVQYAKFNGEIVSANDVSNIFYGIVCASAGIPLKISQWIAKIYSCGLLEPFIAGKIPSKKLLKFRDTASDQRAIVRGYEQYRIHYKKGQQV